MTLQLKTRVASATVPSLVTPSPLVPISLRLVSSVSFGLMYCCPPIAGELLYDSWIVRLLAVRCMCVFSLLVFKLLARS